MKIMIELVKHDYFEDFNESNYKLLKEIPNADYNDYFSKVLISDGVSYTPIYFINKKDILVVGVYDNNTEGLYVTTDFKKRPETVQESKPICPVCGQTYSDAFELSDETEIKCSNCNSNLFVERVVDVSYTTILISKGEVVDLDKEGEEK